MDVHLLIQEKKNKSQVAQEEEEDVESSKREIEKDPATSKIETQGPPEPPKGNDPNFQSSVIANPSSSISFPKRFAKSKKEEVPKEILEIFKKVQVNPH